MKFEAELRMTPEEAIEIFRRGFPVGYIAEGSKITKVVSSGYPIREWVITIKNEEAES